MDPEIHYLFVSLRQGPTMYPRLASNLQQSSYFRLSAGTTDMYITPRPEIYFYLEQHLGVNLEGPEEIPRTQGHKVTR